MDEGSGGFALEQFTGTTAGPWVEPPLRLNGQLFNRKEKRDEPVTLWPMGASLLRSTAFPDMKPIRAIQSEANSGSTGQGGGAELCRGLQSGIPRHGVAEGFGKND